MATSGVIANGGLNLPRTKTAAMNLRHDVIKLHLPRGAFCKIGS